MGSVGSIHGLLFSLCFQIDLRRRVNAHYHRPFCAGGQDARLGKDILTACEVLSCSSDGEGRCLHGGRHRHSLWVMRWRRQASREVSSLQQRLPIFIGDGDAARAQRSKFEWNLHARPQPFPLGSDQVCGLDHLSVGLGEFLSRADDRPRVGGSSSSNRSPTLIESTCGASSSMLRSPETRASPTHDRPGKKMQRGVGIGGGGQGAGRAAALHGGGRGLGAERLLMVAVRPSLGRPMALAGLVHMALGSTRLAGVAAWDCHGPGMTMRGLGSNCLNLVRICRRPQLQRSHAPNA